MSWQKQSQNEHTPGRDDNGVLRLFQDPNLMDVTFGRKYKRTGQTVRTSPYIYVQLFVNG